MAKSISSFKEKLRSVLFFRLNNIFNQDNIGTYKLICPKCRSSNVYTVCSESEHAHTPTHTSDAQPHGDADVDQDAETPRTTKRKAPGNVDS